MNPVASQDLLLRNEYLRELVGEVVDGGGGESDPHRDFPALGVGAGQQEDGIEGVRTVLTEADLDRLRLADHAGGGRGRRLPWNFWIFLRRLVRAGACWCG